MALISIVRGNDGIVRFDPPETTIPKGGVVVFRNDDIRAPHLITRSGQTNPNFWFPYPLAPFVPGTPADTSDEVVFNAVGLVTYTCATHGGETGTINVTA
jgi:plastocyanin